MSKKAAVEYNASTIVQLKGLQAVRKRPAMYLGDPTNGAALHHCVEEVVANSVDEFLGGHCTRIEIVLLPNGGCRVTDDGRGIPVDLHAEAGISALELVLCHLSAGGKFSDSNYKVSAGLHGIGVAAVNGISSSLVATVQREGKVWQQSYEAGIPTAPVKTIGKSKLRGTSIEWYRDLSIISGIVDYDRKTISERVAELAFLNPGLTITLLDAREEKPWEKTYLYEGGIKDYLAEITGRKKNMVPILYFKDSSNSVELAMTWTDTDGEDVRCYANNTFNADGGTHLAGFRNALTRLITTYAKEHNLLKGLSDEGITGNDIREGLQAVVSVKIGDISFSSQTKDKLVTPRAKTLVEELFTDQIVFWFNDNPGAAGKIAARAVIAAKAREAAKRAREGVKRKEWMELSSLPGKLADCQSKDPEECELFIVEGDSAGGSSKGARDRKFQAILPLRGKVLNVERANIEALLENKELGTIITALGCGIEQTRSFDVKKLRYHKIVLMADADVDGAHIRTLLLAFFYRCAPRLLHYGHIYIAMPPLYGARIGGAKNDMFFTGDAELEAFKAGLGEAQLRQLKITRYKGLGEMDAEALWATTLNPENRQLRQVTIDDAIEAEQLFDLLMGDRVEPRRDYIEAHATEATLDV